MMESAAPKHLANSVFSEAEGGKRNSEHQEGGEFHLRETNKHTKTSKLAIKEIINKMIPLKVQIPITKRYFINRKKNRHVREKEKVLLHT